MLNAISNTVQLDPYGLPHQVVNAASVTGTAQSFIFAVMPAPLGRIGVLVLQGTNTGVPTTVTGQVEYSADGGVTWQIYGTASGLNLLGTVVVSSVIPGVYRVNLTALSGGTSPTVSVNAACA